MNLIREWFKNNNIKKQGRIQAGKKEGTHYLFYSCGHPRSVLNYIDGKLHGMQEYYFATGQIKNRIEYFRGMKNGVMESRSIEGDLVLQCFYLDNKLNGEYYTHNGIETVVANYSRGSLNGARRSFEALSSLLQTTDYVDNKKNGDSKVYTKNGVLMQHLRYKDDKLHGECIEYKKGEIYCIQNFKNGLKHGICKTFYPDGKINLDSLFKNNKPIWWKYFDENGKIRQDAKKL